MGFPIAPRLPCPACGSRHNKVRSARTQNLIIRRVRRCEACGARFETHETTFRSLRRRPRKDSPA